MTIEELLNTNGHSVVRTGKEHLEEFVRICENHDVWWCGDRNVKVPQTSLSFYPNNIERDIGLSISIKNGYKSFVFIKADLPNTIEYKDLISEQSITFDDFDLFL